MRKDRNHTLEDLLADESFRKWALDEDLEHSAYWEWWIEQDFGRKELVKKARAILKGQPFSFQEKPLDPHTVRQEWARLAMRRNEQSEKPYKGPKLKRNRRLNVIIWSIRADASGGAADKR